MNLFQPWMLTVRGRIEKVLDLPCAVIITLHRQNEALKNFDQVWEIRSGELIIQKMSRLFLLMKFFLP